MSRTLYTEYFEVLVWSEPAKDWLIAAEFLSHDLAVSYATGRAKTEATKVRQMSRAGRP